MVSLLLSTRRTSLSQPLVASLLLVASCLVACANPPPPERSPPGVTTPRNAASPNDAGTSTVDASTSTVDAGTHSPATPAVDAGRVPVALGEGTCETAADCVVEDTSKACGAHSCSRVARSRDAQRAFEKDLARRCGGAPRDRMPCPLPFVGEAVCEQHRCGLVEIALF